MVWIVPTKEKLEKTKLHFASSRREIQERAMAMEVILTTLGPRWFKN